MSKRRRKNKKERSETPSRDWPRIFAEAALLLLIVVVPLVINKSSTNILDVKDAALGIGVAVGLGLWLLASLKRGRLSWASSRLNPVVLAFLVWCAAGIIYSEYDFATVSGVGRLAALVGIYVLVIGSIATAGQLRRLIAVICVTAVPVCIYGFIQAAGADWIHWDVRLTRIFSTLGNATYLASFLALSIPPALAAAWPQRESSDAGRLKQGWQLAIGALFAGAAVTMGVCLYYTVTLSPAIGLGLGAVLAFAIAVGRGGVRGLRIAIPAALICALVLGLVGLAAYRRLPKTQQRRVQAVLRFEDPYGDERGLLRKTTFDIFRSSPVIGHGYGSFAIYALERLSPSWYTELGHSHEKMLVVSEAHNEYLQVLAETGVIGGALFAALLFGFYAACLRVALRHPEPIWRRMALAALVGGTAFLFQNFFGLTFRETGPAMFFWLWLGVVVVGASQLGPAGEEGGRPRTREIRFRPLSAGGFVAAALVVIAVWGVVVWGMTRIVRGNVLLRRAQALARLDRYGTAAELAEQAIESNPYLPIAYYTAAYVWGKQENYEKCLEANLRALELLPGNASVLYNLAVTYKRLGRLEEAEEAFRRSIELHPTAARHYAALAEMLVQQGRHEEAVEYAEEARRLAPRDAKVYLLLSDVYLGMHDLDETERSLKKAARFEPDDPVVWRRLTELYVRQKKRKQVINACRNWTRLAPDSALAWNILGTAYYGLKRYPKAREALERAVEIQPRYPQARLNLAYTYLRLRQFPEGKQQLEWIVREFPGSPQARQARDLLKAGEPRARP